jgi:GNAT superfamily N-acetyltransferase
VYDRSIFSSPEVVMSALPAAPSTTAPPPLPAGGGAPGPPPAPIGPPLAPAAARTPGAEPRRLEIRDLGPADAYLVDALHARLSPRSQFQRYHSAKPRLNSRERAFLAGTDGVDHVALVALEAGAPVAIARYVKLRGEPGAADIAAEVADHRQRQGLGSDLVARVARRAAGAGVERLTATVLSETGLRRSLVRRGWRVRSYDGPTTTLEVDVWALLRL